MLLANTSSADPLRALLLRAEEASLRGDARVRSVVAAMRDARG